MKMHKNSSMLLSLLLHVHSTPHVEKSTESVLKMQEYTNSAREFTALHKFKMTISNYTSNKN